MARAAQRTAARRDFLIHYKYLAETAGLAIAKRFRRAVELTTQNSPKILVSGAWQSSAKKARWRPTLASP